MVGRRRTPMHAVRPAGVVDAASGFGRLDIAACGSCGHLSNTAFDTDAADELYGALVLTNEPVSPGMIAAVDETAALIMRHLKQEPAVLEIGGGGGALSLALARRSARVDLVEPSRALRRRALCRHRRDAASRDVSGAGARRAPLRCGGVPPGHRACAGARAVPGRASREPRR